MSAAAVLIGGFSSPFTRSSSPVFRCSPSNLRCTTPTEPTLRLVTRRLNKLTFDDTKDVYVNVNIGGQAQLVSVVKQVGKGSFSTVFSVQSLSRKDEFFAFKTCEQGSYESKLLKHEFEVLNTLPGSVYTQGKPVDFVEYAVRGVNCVGILSKLYACNLLQAIQGDKIPVEKREKVAWQLVSILEHIVKNEIYHIDIHLENFLVEWEGDEPKVVLSDFGGLPTLEGDFTEFVFPKYESMKSEYEKVTELILERSPGAKVGIANLQTRLMGIALVHLILGSKILPDNLEAQLQHITPKLREKILDMVTVKECAGSTQ